jgi:hypothetical protein
MQHTRYRRRKRGCINDIEVTGQVVAADDDRLDHPRIDESRHLPHASRDLRTDADRQVRDRPQPEGGELLTAEHGVGEIVEAQREQAGQPVATARARRPQNGAIRHGFRPGDILVDRHR